jgi:hypothetical protein
VDGGATAAAQLRLIGSVKGSRLVALCATACAVRGTFPLPRGVPFKLVDNDHSRRMERSMNMHIATIAGRVEAELAGERPSRGEAEAAARVLLAWAGEDPARDGARDLSELLTDGRTALYPDFNRSYPRDFAPDGDYLATLPDLQNGPESLIKGARTQLQHVGISNFRLPVRYHTRDGGDETLETSVTGSVSLEADRKGINMSRIMRTFYRHAEKKFSFEVIDAVLEDYLADLDSYDARIQMRFSYPMKKRVAAQRARGLSVLRHRARGGEDRRADAEDRASRLCLFLDLPLLAGTERTCAPDAAADRDAAFPALGGAGVGGGPRRRAAVVRGRGRALHRRDPHRDAGDGQARGRAGLRRAERVAPDLRGGCGAAPVPTACRATRASATSAWWRAIRNRCIPTMRCRS